MTKLIRWSAAVLAPLSLAALPAPLLAQQDPAAPSGPICLVRAGNSPDSNAFVAVVPAAEQAAMTGKGFAVQPCSGDSAAFASYRARVCHLANDTPAVVQGQFEQEYNVSPRALCDMADAVAAAG